MVVPEESPEEEEGMPAHVLESLRLVLSRCEDPEAFSMDTPFPNIGPVSIVGEPNAVRYLVSHLQSVMGFANKIRRREATK